LTDPSQSYLVPFWMGRMILTLLVPSAPTRMSRRRPPHSPLAWLRVMTEELEMVGLPCAGSCTVKGMLVACWHVSTWVRPCSEDSRIGIRKAPSRAMSARRERRTDGTKQSYRTLNPHDRCGQRCSCCFCPPAPRPQLQPGPHPAPGGR